MDGYEKYDHSYGPGHRRVYDTYNGLDFVESYVTHVISGFDQKSSSVRSDHHKPTAYERRVGKVTSDKPTHILDIAFHGKREETFHLGDDYSGANKFLYPPGWEIANITDRTITMAREKLGDSSGFDVGVALAEAKATAEMLAGTGIQMARGLIHLKSVANQINRMRVREAFLAAAGKWLEGYYGWGSLARDAFQLTGALQAQVQQPLLLDVKKVSKSSKSWGPYDDVNCRRRWIDAEGVVVCGYTARIADEFARSLNKWGVANPYSIAWELVPMSFVVDWFVPIGNVLSSLSATVGLEFYSGYLSQVQNSKRRVQYWNTNPYKSEQELDHGDFVVETKEFTRRVLHGFEMPRLYANENPFSTNRVVSASALITQAVLK